MVSCDGMKTFSKESSVQGSVTTILSTPTLLMFTLKEFKKNFTET
jgi:hypothetical protein